MARQSVALYPLSVVIWTAVALYLAVSGRWALVAGVIIAAVFGWFQFLFAKWWIRTGEDNDIREWLRDNPDYGSSDRS